jgi:hypothetical protein
MFNAKESHREYKAGVSTLLGRWQSLVSKFYQQIQKQLCLRKTFHLWGDVPQRRAACFSRLGTLNTWWDGVVVVE